MNLRDRIKLGEGLRLHAYPDPLTHADPWTIGYGHTGSDVHQNTVWTQEQAEKALDADIEHAKEALIKSLPWVANLDSVRLGVLIEMTFNMGISHLLGFTNTLAFIKSGDYGSAAVNILKSMWAKQVGSRAIRLAKILRTGKEDNNE